MNVVVVVVASVGHGRTTIVSCINVQSRGEKKGFKKSCVERFGGLSIG